MKYGIFTSEILEIVQTKKWAVCLYCNEEKSKIGARLYKGNDEKKELIAICERYVSEEKTAYAYVSEEQSINTNDFYGVSKCLGSVFDYNISELKRIEELQITEPYILPFVSEVGIEECLRQWRKGSFFWQLDDGILFELVSNKIEYVFSIQNKECNIYCGASVNIPYENGMLGRNQYFRMRNYGDNSMPWCRFICDLGNTIIIPRVERVFCDSDQCTTTEQGLYWPVKRYNEEEIVLAGCGGDEYFYKRNSEKSEYFL